MRIRIKRFGERSLPIIVVAAGLMLALAPVEAAARAGGGQHFGGGGHSGHGGGYAGGGGGLFSLWPLLFFSHGNGFTGIIILIIIAYLYQQMQSRRAQAWLPGAASYGEAPASTAVALPVEQVDPQAVSSGLAAIKTRDPNFDEQAFLDQAQTAFFKVQQAWAARNQDLSRDVMSDALYERHKMQTDQLIANHQIDVLENIVIGSARVINVVAGPPYDAITVEFAASMQDYTIDENTKRVVDGNQYPQTFTENWTFIRRGDAKSAVGQTSLAPTCPSCGAPLKLTNGRCDYCAAYVKTSSSTWVVDSIEQVG